MSYGEKRKLRKIAEKAVRQGGQSEKIQEFLGIFVHAFRCEYTEDNKITSDSFIIEQLGEVLRDVDLWCEYINTP